MGKMMMLDAKVESARDTVERAIARARSPYIGFSGGKDSTVVLHLAHSVDPTLPVLFVDDELLFDEHAAFVESERRRVLDADGEFMAICKRSGSLHSSWFRPWDSKPYWRPPLEDAQFVNTPNTAPWMRKQGFDAMILGLRGDENRYREARFAARRDPGIDRRQGMLDVNPMHDWTCQDVWDYIEREGIVYCPTYDRMSKVGIHPLAARLHPIPLIDVEVLLRGWPDVYLRMLRRYGARVPRPPNLGRRLRTRNKWGIPSLLWIEIQEALAGGV